MIHNYPFDKIPLGRMLGNFDSHMKRKLMMKFICILLHVKKPKQSFHEVLPPFGQIMNIFRSETERMFEHNAILRDKIQHIYVIENPSFFAREREKEKKADFTQANFSYHTER